MECPDGRPNQILTNFLFHLFAPYFVSCSDIVQFLDRQLSFGLETVRRDAPVIRHANDSPVRFGGPRAGVGNEAFQPQGCICVHFHIQTQPSYEISEFVEVFIGGRELRIRPFRMACIAILESHLSQ